MGFKFGMPSSASSWRVLAHSWVYWHQSLISIPDFLALRATKSMNAGRPVEDVYFGPVTIQPGEQISTDLVGPPTTAYIDSTNCRVVSP